jgi:3-deoxy-D-manno-octulosonic-acid transferase
LQYLKKAWLQKDATKASVQWLIVPRHPYRFNEVVELITQHGFKVSKRSEWLDHPDVGDSNTIWLGDTLGEMAMYYGMSDVALLGGSFESLGGQNLIEAAACGCPVVMGPSTFNFTEAAHQAILVKAAFQCANLTEAANTSLELLNQAERLKLARISALKFASSHQGAAGKTATAVQNLLRQQSVDR